MYEVRSALQCNFAIHNTYTEYFLNRNQKGDFKMTKKIMSMILSIAMVLSVAVVGISGTYAAEVSDKTSEVGAGNNIYFNVKKSGWSNVKTVYCHIWRADGTGPIGRQRKKNVSMIPQRVLQLMIFLRQDTILKNRMVNFTV